MVVVIKEVESSEVRSQVAVEDAAVAEVVTVVEANSHAAELGTKQLLHNFARVV